LQWKALLRKLLFTQREVDAMPGGPVSVLAMIQAIGEPTRFEIMRLIGSRELAAGEIARQFAVTRPAVSHHLGVLRVAGLLQERRDGTRRLYTLRPEALAELRNFIDGFWEPRLKRLKRAAEAMERSKKVR
jgi:DNA-binding transcriptional ArsR family regulator